ncbi:FUSC family protein [Desulfovibrio mangrovi]|uniref:FUSC family protein n=1 Tax=Desulfovibrio mangrovi TaxID=2976983 RepID=UPI0022478E19|nr:FUSC family protein [Desulfovibrio mangrovi]UZP66992.1 FUSC family protein [Desulfovibrio mangrovi]
MPLSDLDSTAAHIRHGIKTGIAALLALVIASLLDPKFGMWAVVSSVIVMQVNVAESIQMCWYRFTGTAVGAVIGILGIVLFPPTFLGTSLALFTTVGFCAYMTRHNPRYRMAAITVAIVLIASLGVENRITFSLMRVVEIAIGVLCSYVVSIWILPARVGEALKARLQNQFSRAADTYGQLVEDFLGDSVSTTEETLAPLLKDIAGNRDLFRKMLRHESPLFDDNASLMDRQIVVLEQCARHLAGMLRTVQDMREGGYNLIMAPEIRAVVTASREAMRAIGEGVAPSVESLRALLDKSDRKLEELRESGATKRFSVRELVQVLAFYHYVQRMGEDLQTAFIRPDGSARV